MTTSIWQLGKNAESYTTVFMVWCVKQ